MNKFIIFGSIGLVALLLFKSVSKKIQIIGLPSIKFGKPGSLSIPFTVSIAINNQNNFNLNIDNYLGTLKYQGNDLVNFSTGKIIIGPGQTKQITIYGNIAYLSIGLNILYIIESKKFDSKFTVNSNLIYENITVPLNYDLNIV